MNGLPVELPAAAMVRVTGPGQAGAGFFVPAVSADGPIVLIVTCAHLLPGYTPGAIVTVKQHIAGQPLSAEVVLLQDQPDVAVLRPTGLVPPEAVVLPLGRSPATVPTEGLRTFGYPKVRPVAGLPGAVVYDGDTADAGHKQLVLKSDVATLGYSGAPVWDPELGVVVGMVKSIAIGDPGHRLRNTGFGVPVEVIRELCPQLRLPAGCPYRGLEPFTEEHVDFYFGRDRATSQLLASLSAGHFVPVVAVSGSGKSSLLQAGLAKGLRNQPAVGLAKRVPCYQRVGSHPHAELLHCLARHGIELPPELTTAPPEKLADAIRGAAHPRELIVVVDQFERLYTQCEDAGERKRFVGLLQCLASDTVKVAIGLRADFFHLALPDLGERLASGLVALARMTDQELAQAITMPAEKLLRSFQPGLTRQLIADVRGDPGDLPLLQFALTQLWERDAAGGVLTADTYQDLGVDFADGTHLPGAQGALIGRAEELWESLGLADQPRLQRILFGLIAEPPAGAGSASLGADTDDLSQPALLAEWGSDDQRLVHQLVAARLLTAGRTRVGGQPTVEVSHEILLRAWPRLHTWLKERSQFVRWRANDFAPSFKRWLSSSDRREKHQALLRGRQLGVALQWLRNFPAGLTGPAADYIRASSRRRTRLLWLAGCVVVVLVVASLTLNGIFYSLQQTANQARGEANNRLIIAEARQYATRNLPLAAQLTLAAYRIHQTPDLATGLLNTENTPLSVPLTSDGGVAAVAFSPDHQTLASADAAMVQLWDVADPAHPQALGQPLHSSNGGGVDAVAFSPDGRTLASGNTDSTIRLWDVADPAHPRPLGQPLTSSGGAVFAVAFSRDSRTLAVDNGDRTIRLWDVADPAHPRPLGKPLTNGTFVEALTFSRSGHTLASGNLDGTVRMWDVADPAHPRPLGQPLTSGSGNTIISVAFSSDGRTLASGNTDGTVRLWDVADPAHPRPLGQPLTIADSGGVGPVAFSPDSHTLASGSADGTVQLWDVADPADPRPLGQPLTSGSGGAIDAVAFSPDGRTLASGNLGGVVRLWSLTLTVLTGGGAVGAVAFSPDSHTLASGSADGTVQLWDVVDPADPRPLGQPLTSGSGGAIDAVAFSPDGRTLASGNSNGKVWLWDVAHPARPRPLGRPLTSGNYGDTAVSFSPDGHTLATGNNDGTIRLWDVTDPAHARPLGQPLTSDGYVIAAVTFSPHGHTLASGDDNGTVRLWDVAKPAHPGPLGQPLTGGTTSFVHAVAFSPDGRTLATAYEDGTVGLWDVANPAHARLLGQPLSSGSGNAVYAVAFSPDSHTLASGNIDGTVGLWDVANPAHARLLGQPLTTGGSYAVDAVAFSPDGRTLASGTDDAVTWLWNLSVQDAIKRICATAGNLTPQQWNQYIPEPYQPLCASGSHPASGAVQPTAPATQPPARATQPPAVVPTLDKSCTTQVLSHDSQTLVQYFLTNKAVQRVLGDLPTGSTAGSAAALATLETDATKLETEAHAAASHPPPACADPAGFQKSMQDLVTVAKDCMLVVNDLRSGNQAAAITQETAILAVLDASNNALGKFTAALGAG